MKRGNITKTFLLTITLLLIILVSLSIVSSQQNNHNKEGFFYNLFTNPVTFFMQIIGLEEPGYIEEIYGDQCKNSDGSIRVGERCEINGEIGYCDDKGKCILGQPPLVPIAPPEEPPIIPEEPEIAEESKKCDPPCKECEMCNTGELGLETKVTDLGDLRFFIRNPKKEYNIISSVPLYNPTDKSRIYKVYPFLREQYHNVVGIEEQEGIVKRGNEYFLVIGPKEEKSLEFEIDPSIPHGSLYLEYGDYDTGIYTYARKIDIFIINDETSETLEPKCVPAPEKNYEDCTDFEGESGYCDNGRCVKDDCIELIKNTGYIGNTRVILRTGGQPPLPPKALDQHLKQLCEFYDSIPEDAKEIMKLITIDSRFIMPEHEGSKTLGSALPNGHFVISQTTAYPDRETKREIREAFVYTEDYNKPYEEREKLANSPKWGVTETYGARNIHEHIATFVTFVVLNPEKFKELLSPSNPWHKEYREFLELLYEYPGFITDKEYQTALEGNPGKIYANPYYWIYRHEIAHGNHFRLRIEETGRPDLPSQFDIEWMRIANSIRPGGIYEKNGFNGEYPNKGVITRLK